MPAIPSLASVAAIPHPGGGSGRPSGYLGLRVWETHAKTQSQSQRHTERLRNNEGIPVLSVSGQRFQTGVQALSQRHASAVRQPPLSQHFLNTFSQLGHQSSCSWLESQTVQHRIQPGLWVRGNGPIAMDQMGPLVPLGTFSPFWQSGWSTSQSATLPTSAADRKPLTMQAASRARGRISLAARRRSQHARPHRKLAGGR
eukprot:358956-Chlamydomonas_euryale.AAC.3